MGISVADNFSYLGGKPLDGRIQYATLAAMKAMADATLYEGCEAYCVETDRYYKWKSSNTVDASTGKWREFEGGGGSIPVATANTLGGIKVGSGLTITQDGTLSALSAPVALGDVTSSAAAIVDKSTGEVHISWNDPDDVPGETGGYLAQWKQTLVVKKVGSAPISPSDGTTICTNLVKNQYSSGTGYVTDTISTDSSVFTYYRFFPVSTQDITTYGAVKKMNVASVVYGFRITQGISDPSLRVEYLEDAVGMTPAHMDYTNNTFDYGDWASAFFIAGLKPVMLYNDGTEAYALNPNNLAQKADGTASDIANTSFDGNAMMRIPKVYIKSYQDADDIFVYISDDQLDSDYHCWAHHDDQGNEIPYLYLPIFNGVLSGTKMRSLSGDIPNNDTLDTTQITYCDNNNPQGKYIWSCYTLSSWMLILYLMTLISKSTNTQVAFGNGNYSGGSVNSLLRTGTANDRGLFYGTNGSGSAVKVFGLENWYGNIYKRVIGLGSSNNVYKYKLTYGQEDGSTADGYSNSMTGYKSAGYTAPYADQQYIKTLKCFDSIMLPYQTGAGDSTYYADGLWCQSGDRIAYLGGDCNYGKYAGGFCTMTYHASGSKYWNYGAGIECRPRLGEESIVS